MDKKLLNINNNFRWNLLPYKLQKVIGSTNLYIAYNRYYECIWSDRYIEIHKSKIVSLSINKNDINTDSIYLYNDANLPENNKIYQDKLEKLYTCKVFIQKK